MNFHGVWGTFSRPRPYTPPGYRKRFRMFRKFLVAGLVPLFAACTCFAQADIQSLSQEQLAFVDRTCTQVLGLKPGENYFGGCRQTLSATLVTAMQDQALAWAYQSCRKQGLAQKSAALSACMLDRKSSAPATAVEPLSVAHPATDKARATMSFYEMSPSERFNRERYACTQLGLE